MVSRVVLPAHMDLIEIQSFIPQPSAGHAVMGAQPGVVLCPLRPPPAVSPAIPEPRVQRWWPICMWGSEGRGDTFRGARGQGARPDGSHGRAPPPRALRAHSCNTFVCHLIKAH